MTHIKSYTLNVLIIIALFFITLSSFKPGTEEKQVMTIDIWQFGPAAKFLGIYVYVEGKKIEFIQSGINDNNQEELISRGETFNSTLNKYYKEGWRVVATTTAPPIGGNYYSRYTLEK